MGGVAVGVAGVLGGVSVGEALAVVAEGVVVDAGGLAGEGVVVRAPREGVAVATGRRGEGRAGRAGLSVGGGV